MRKYVTPSIVISLIALTLSLMGAGYAGFILPRDSVGREQIKAGAVGSSEIANGSLRPVDFSKAAIRKLTGVQGPKGDAGARGETGARGEAGPAGAAGSGGGAAAGGCVLVTNPTPTQFTDCQNDLTSLWGRQASGPGMNFRYANFSGSNLAYMGFYGQNFSYAIFRGTNLRGTDFRQADLTGADFTDADLTRVWGRNSTFDNSTIVTGVVWSNTICPDGTNSDANGNTCVGHY